MREVMKVINADDKFIYISLAATEAACSSCAIAGSCSIKETGKEMKIAKSAIKKDMLPLIIGDIVIVDMKYNTALLSLIVYGIPLAGFISGVLIGYLSRLQDVFSFSLGLLFAGIGALITRFFDKKYKIEIIDVKRFNQFNQFNQFDQFDKLNDRSNNSTNRA